MIPILAEISFGSGDLTGPVAALVGAIIVIGALWRDHQESRKRDFATIEWQRTVIENTAKAMDALTEVVEDSIQDRLPPTGGK